MGKWKERGGKIGCIKKTKQNPSELLGVVKGAERGEQGNTEKGEPAELGNRRPFNRRCSGDVFKGSFLTAGCARSQEKCSSLQGGGVSGVFGWRCHRALWGGRQLDCQILASPQEAGLAFWWLGSIRSPPPAPHLPNHQKKKKKEQMKSGFQPWENNQHHHFSQSSELGHRNHF